ncbi:cilia- and flagella-associated protein 43-like [Cyprinodon tularosa]|uniref:cilia- and flagella-associated protein 43-like n=1 Tax=Cyprinodon tularosa TaxID=77115 RepID=UPI0018E1EAE1|nr:cilia- and flagella-associated protein 43-like [Cyprinodon tularosa]
MNEVGSLEISWIQGFTGENVEFLDDRTVCYRCGNHISFLNLETKSRSVFQSPGRGVGALTANGKIGVFAFSERKLNPSIFVYTFPELDLKNELKGDARMDYTCMTLSDGGPYLGCCSSLPEFSITIWNWQSAEVLCTQSQAGNYVISLHFNPMNWLQLCALGTTTVTVWKIERCGRFHILSPSIVPLPATDVFLAENLHPPPAKNPTCFVPDMRFSSQHTRDTVTPSSLCWTATSQLNVGCSEGHLLLVDPESLSVFVLFNPAAADPIPELQNFCFQALSFTRNDLIAVDKEGVVHCLEFRQRKIHITQTWKLERPISTAVLSPDDKTLLLSSKTGQIYLLNLAKSDHIEEALNILSGNFLTATSCQTDKTDICVSLREGGVLQLWSSDGTCIGSLDLQTEATTLACCPIANYAAVGTASGKVQFIDLNDEKQLCLVHEVYLYHTAVDHLVFDQEGHYLFCSGLDLHLYVLNPRPSARFSVIGYIDVPGHILSLSTQCLPVESGELKILILCATQDGNDHGSLLIVYSMPVGLTEVSEFVDRNGCLHIPKKFTYKVQPPLTSCALGVDEVFAYCQSKKSLQRFQLPKETNDPSSQQMIQLKPKDQVKGHPLGPACVLLSPDSLWLASVGRDGLLRIRPTAFMGQYCELWCHSCRLGGVRTVSFSEDSNTVFTTGLKDGSLQCTKLRLSYRREDAYRDMIALPLRTLFLVENSELRKLSVWVEKTPVGCNNTEEDAVSCAALIDARERDASYISPAQNSNSTWKEKRQEAIVKEDNEKCAETKTYLREEMTSIREALQKLMLENEHVPIEEFNLDVEGQRAMDSMVEEEAEKVRAEIQLDIAKNRHLYDVMKRECWDSFMVKPRSIMAFHSEMEVKNYPLKERTEKELEDLHRVQNIRKNEMAANRLSGQEKSDSEPEEEPAEEEGHGAESTALSGSISAQLGYFNPYLYNQFSLKTIEQRSNQIILLQDLVYDIKMDFNSDFEALHRGKLEVLRHVKDGNKRIRELMLKLDIEQKLWEPSLTDSEWPERLFTLDDSEIKAEKYLNLEQKEEEEEERRRLATENHLTAHEMPPPEFVLTKAETQCCIEEREVCKENERSFKDLDKEDGIKAPEIEMKALQQSIKYKTENFDKMLAELEEKKLKCTIAIDQEEMKIINLNYTVIKAEQLDNQEQKLKLKLEQASAHKMKMAIALRTYKEEVKQFQWEYDRIVAEDKVLDKQFRRDFADVPNNMVKQLYKLFKCRPKVQVLRAQTGNPPNFLKQRHLTDSASPDGLSQLLKAMEKLDAPENMPKMLKPSIWKRFCLVRKTKVECEQTIHRKALNLAEMQAFLQRRKDQLDLAEKEISQISDAIRSVVDERNEHLTNYTVQVVVKYGQVEPSVLSTDTPGENAAIVHRSVVENLTALKKANTKVHKNIAHLEWENRVLNKKLEILKEQKREIRRLKLSEEQKEMMFLSRQDWSTHTEEKISKMEQSIALMKKIHEKNIQQRKKRLQGVKKKMAKIAESNADLEKELPRVQETVAKLTQIYERGAGTEDEDAKREKRFQEIRKKAIQKRRAKAQSEELERLQRDQQRLERKYYPTFD